jgi:hypothetical protein
MKVKEKVIRKTISIYPKINRQIKTIAKKYQRSESEIIKIAIEKLLEEEEN